MTNDNLPRLVIYSRRSCPACEDMILDLDEMLSGRGVNFTVVDIDSDAQLVEKYGLRVPVLTLNDREIGHFLLDREIVEEELVKVS